MLSMIFFFSEDWLLEREIDIGEMASSAAKYRGASVEDLQLPEVVSVLTTDLISSAYQTMISREFSQVPVVNVSRQIVGFVAKEDVEMLLQKKSIDFNKDTVEQHCVSTDKERENLGKSYRFLVLS